MRKLLLEMNDEFLSLIESIHELKQLMESNTYTNFFHDLTKWYDGLNDDRAIRDMVRGQIVEKLKSDLSQYYQAVQLAKNKESNLDILMAEIK